MVIGSFNDNLNKVKTKEELLDFLKEYRGILTKPMLDYLDSLIELEFSVMKEYISSSDRKKLAELDIYKEIAIYNIYNRVINLFNQHDGEFIISVRKEGLEKLSNLTKLLSVSTKLSDRNINLFDFGYKEKSAEYQARNRNFYECQTRISNDYKAINIGHISLFQSIESNEMRNAELDRVMKRLNRLRGERNPYPPSRPGIVGGGPEVTWAFEHENKIRECEEYIKQLNSKKELNAEDKREIEITGQIHDLLLEELCLSSEGFVEEKGQSLGYFLLEKTKLRKTLVKKMPNLIIEDCIRYI